MPPTPTMPVTSYAPIRVPGVREISGVGMPIMAREVARVRQKNTPALRLYLFAARVGGARTSAGNRQPGAACRDSTAISPSGRRDEARDAIVVRGRVAAAVAIVRAEVHVAIGPGDDVADASELSFEQTLLSNQPARGRIDSKPQQQRASQRGDEEIVRELGEPLAAVEGRPAWRNRGVVERDRSTHRWQRLIALNSRPSVVRSTIHDVDLVVAGCTVLRRPQIAGRRVPVEPLRVPMPVRVDG